MDFHCRKCLEGENGLFQSVLLKEVVIEPNVKLECVPKFCYLGDTLGAGGGVEEAERARVSQWFGHLECRSVDDWVSACRTVEVAGRDVRGGKGRLGMNVWRIIII